MNEWTHKSAKLPPVTAPTSHPNMYKLLANVWSPWSSHVKLNCKKIELTLIELELNKFQRVYWLQWPPCPQRRSCRRPTGRRWRSARRWSRPDIGPRPSSWRRNDGNGPTCLCRRMGWSCWARAGRRSDLFRCRSRWPNTCNMQILFKFLMR